MFILCVLICLIFENELYKIFYSEYFGYSTPNVSAFLFRIFCWVVVDAVLGSVVWGCYDSF